MNALNALAVVLDLGNYTHQDVTKAAAELRRLHEMNERSLRHIHRHAIEIERLTEENAALHQATKEAALNGLAATSREIEQWDASDMAHRAGGLSVEQEPVAWNGDCVLGHCGSPDGCDRSGCCRADTAPPDDLLRQSEREGWRWARECEAEVKRLRELVDSQKPVMWLLSKDQEPPKREWVGLTDEEIDAIYASTDFEVYANLVRAIEAKLRSKNHG
jgi:hypothetical protein